MAIQEGIASAKALAARVTVLTVTTPFHVFTTNPSTLRDTPKRYRRHTEALAQQYLDVAEDFASKAEYHVIWCTLNMSTLIGRLSIPLRAEALTQYKWRHIDDADIGGFARQRNPQGANAQRHPGHCLPPTAFRYAFSEFICILIRQLGLQFDEILERGRSTEVGDEPGMKFEVISTDDRMDLRPTAVTDGNFSVYEFGFCVLKRPLFTRSGRSPTTE